MEIANGGFLLPYMNNVNVSKNIQKFVKKWLRKGYRKNNLKVHFMRFKLQLYNSFKHAFVYYNSRDRDMS